MHCFAALRVRDAVSSRGNSHTWRGRQCAEHGWRRRGRGAVAGVARLSGDREGRSERADGFRCHAHLHLMQVRLIHATRYKITLLAGRNLRLGFGLGEERQVLSQDRAQQQQQKPQRMVAAQVNRAESHQGTNPDESNNPDTLRDFHRTSILTGEWVSCILLNWRSDPAGWRAAGTLYLRRPPSTYIHASARRTAPAGSRVRATCCHTCSPDTWLPSRNPVSIHPYVPCSKSYMRKAAHDRSWSYMTVVCAPQSHTEKNQSFSGSLRGT